jgi:hypothetical protein
MREFRMPSLRLPIPNRAGIRTREPVAGIIF